MTNEQILAVLSLRDHQAFDHASVSTHKGLISVSIGTAVDADYNEVDAELAKIFPDMVYDEPGNYPVEGKNLNDELFFIHTSDVFVSLHFYHTLEKEKAPANAEELKENLSPDYTAIDEIVAREA